MTKGYVEPNNPEYQQWIDDNVPVNCRQGCLTKAEAMAKEFPELKVVGAPCPWTGYGHAWCVNANNEVVDPTSHQFADKYNYQCARLERSEFPSRCPYCGNEIWTDIPAIRVYLNQSADEFINDHPRCMVALMQELIEDGMDEDEAAEAVGL